MTSLIACYERWWLRIEVVACYFQHTVTHAAGRVLKLATAAVVISLEKTFLRKKMTHRQNHIQQL